MTVMSADTTTPTTEPCVPEGSTLVDVETGEVWVVPRTGYVGADSCGNDVPDICVEWRPGTQWANFSRLWSLEPCGPVDDPVDDPVVTVAVSDAPEPVTELPATGGSGVLLIVAIGLAALGVVLFGLARRSEPES